jgi:hypothetical protein
MSPRVAAASKGQVTRRTVVSAEGTPHVNSQTARNKATFSRFHDGTAATWRSCQGRSTKIVDPNVRFHAPVPLDATGPQALKLVWAVLLRAFPDLQVTVEDVIAEGDKVVWACHQPAKPSAATKYSSSASPTAELPRFGASLTSSHSCGNSVPCHLSRRPYEVGLNRTREPHVVLGFMFALHGTQKLFAWPPAEPLRAAAPIGSWPYWWVGVIEVATGILISSDYPLA